MTSFDIAALDRDVTGDWQQVVRRHGRAGRSRLPTSTFDMRPRHQHGGWAYGQKNHQVISKVACRSALHRGQLWEDKESGREAHQVHT